MGDPHHHGGSQGRDFSGGSRRWGGGEFGGNSGALAAGRFAVIRDIFTFLGAGFWVAATCGGEV